MAGQKISLNSFTNSVFAFIQISKEAIEVYIADSADVAKCIPYSNMLERIKLFKAKFENIFDQEKCPLKEREEFFSFTKKRLGKKVMKESNFFENMKTKFPPKTGEEGDLSFFRDLFNFEFKIKCAEDISLEMSDIMKEINYFIRENSKFQIYYVQVLITFFSILSYISDVEESISICISNTKDCLLNISNHMAEVKTQDNSPLNMLKNFMNKNDLGGVFKNVVGALNIQENLPALMKNIEETTGANLDGIKDIFEGDITDIDSMQKKIKEKFSDGSALKDMINKNKGAIDTMGTQLMESIREGTEALAHPRKKEEIIYDVDTFEDDEE
jgi:hypothetical protein